MPTIKSFRRKETHMTIATAAFDLPSDDENELLNCFKRIHELRQTLPDPEAPIRLRDAAGKPREPNEVEAEILECERKALKIVDGYFRGSLPGLMTTLFGKGVVSTKQDASVRFTEMLNNFFIKMLEKRPDEFWRAQTAKDLRKWASVANANLMRDILRRDSRGNRILREQLAPLVAERSRHFQKTVERPLDDRVMETLREWSESDDRVRRQWALVMQYRYLDGMPYAEIAHMLGISEGTVQQRRSAAIEWLRENLK